MTEALITPGKFREMYPEFKNSYAGPNPIYVHYYIENRVVHFYMKFLDVLYHTRIGIEDLNMYIVNFDKTIQLSENMGA